MSLYSFIVIIVAIHRISGLMISARHEKILRAQGAIEYGQGHFWPMKIFHTTWLIGCLALSWDKTFIFDQSTIIFSAIFLIGVMLRFYSQIKLGVFWTENVLVLPNHQKINSGIYQFFNHPNYLGVCLEIFALPAMAKLWSFTILSTVMNSLLVYFRIKTENKALSMCQKELA